VVFVSRVYTFVLTVQAPLRAWVELVCRHDDLDETEMNRTVPQTSVEQGVVDVEDSATDECQHDECRHGDRATVS
jgi:hypothetical protein